MKAELFEDMTIEDYHDRLDVQSKTMLKEFIDCPARYKYKYFDGGVEKEKQKDHMNLGHAVHTLALEPHLFDKTYYILPEGIVRNKKHKAFQEQLKEANGRKIIRTEDLVNIEGMANSLKANKQALALLDAPGKIEASIFWTDPETGLKCRARPDFMRDDSLIVDLKMSYTAEPKLFQNTAFNMCYDVSAALTTRGYEALYGKKPDNYVFLVIEPEPPYIVEGYDAFRPFEDGVSYLNVGNTRLNAALNRLVECKKTGHWPGYNNGIKPLGIPYYAKKLLDEGAAA